MTEERKTKEQQNLERMREFARQRGLNVKIGLIPDEKLPKGPVRYTFFGEARRAPEHGDEVEVRVEDGTWRAGYRVINGPTTHEEFPGERVAWITSEEEWAKASASENRRTAGQPWPIAQIRLANAEVSSLAVGKARAGEGPGKLGS